MLNGYLCLRKLVVQRTKLIDETQDMLLEMLEDMTTGTLVPDTGHLTHNTLFSPLVCWIVGLSYFLPVC